MRENGIIGRRRRAFKRTTDSKHGGPIARNVLRRQFNVREPNLVWVTDVTAIATADGWLYLAVMLGLFSRRVVGWAGSDHNDTTLALCALRMALRLRRPAPELVHHPRRASPYASEDYWEELRDHEVCQCMSRKGDCWDNAVAEGFFATLRAELIDHQRYATRDVALQNIATTSKPSTTSSFAILTSATSTPPSSNCVHKIAQALHSQAVHKNGRAPF